MRAVSAMIESTLDEQTREDLAALFGDDCPTDPWPPTDADEMARLDAWTDDREREYLERVGNDFDHPEA